MHHGGPPIKPQRRESDRCRSAATPSASARALASMSDGSSKRRDPLEPRLDAERGVAHVERVHDGRHVRFIGIAMHGFG